MTGTGVGAGTGAGAAPHDPLQVLRAYRTLAPWNLRDLAGLVGAILDASGITPINAAARAQPSERTIRFYVTQGLVSPPEGRGTAATYSYRHFLQLLWIKLRQMEGGTLAAITKEMKDQTGDVLERRAAQALGASLPVPDRLTLNSKGGSPRGKSGRALTAWIARDAERDPETPSSWRRIPVGRGLELHVEAAHPLARLGPGDDAVADAVRQTLAKLVPPASA
ncbi:MAG TPA: MerR family transcriptional regulator [Gemmatimonadales bacterium]|nr:MerR family transcriptional regulator [Gemmatimonadales bacterium]